MRRIIVLSLVAALAVFGIVALVGCGDTTTTTAAPESTTTAPPSGDTTTTAAPVEGVTPLDPPVTVKVAYDNAPGTAGIILADKMGF
ncbi:MAG: hypothetical protein ACYC8U_18085, partial [Thermoleophilia bacterium]